ncbi:tetratricopeptide repeat protein [Kordiimonas aquimaris]|uniref:tetratricopeptide repeat protein n=1 Tax=Kordiimonas aquimaris TaxID=707591 RepID=UPI0021D041F6|nr:hypothetical protein [Kordiimonas aquimaris]
MLVYQEGPVYSFMSYTIPPPDEWQTFESNMKQLLMLVLKARSIQTYGRQGQKQLGVDLYASRDDNPGHFVGIQCKQKTWDKRITKTILRNEVKEARKFTPALSEYILVTTAKDDVKIQAEAAQLQAELSTTNTPFTINVWGWGTICQEIERFKSEGMLQLWFPDLKAVVQQETQSGPGQVRDLDDVANSIQNFLQNAQDEANLAAGEKIDENHHRDIDVYNKKLRAGQYGLALEFFETKLKSIDDTTSDRVRFRLLSNIGACYHNLGQRDQAIRFFETAFSFAPDGDGQAHANYVLAAFLRGDMEDCQTRALEACSLDNPRLLSAFYLIFSSPDAPTLTKNLALIPAGLEDKGQIIAGETDRLRELGDPSFETKVQGLRASEHLEARRVWADHVLSQYFTASKTSKAICPAIDGEVLEEATDVYRAVWQQVKDGHTQAIHLGFANNHAMLLLATHKVEEAITVLREAREANPNDCGLAYALATTLAQEQGKFDEALQLMEGFDLSAEHALFCADLHVETDTEQSLALINAYDWSKEKPTLALHARCIEFAASYSPNSESPEVDRFLSTFEQEFPDSVIPNCLQAKVEMSRSGAITDVTHEKVTAKLPSVTKRNDLINAAEVLLRGSHFEEAFQILNLETDFSRAGPDLHMLIDAAARSGNPRYYLSVFQRLRPDVIGEDTYYRRMADVGMKIQDLPLALEGLKRALAISSFEPSLCINYIDTLHRTGDTKKACTFMATLPMPLNADMPTQIAVLQRAFHFDTMENAFERLYRLVLKHPSDESLYVFALMALTINMERAPSPPLPEVISSDCWVRVKPSRGNETNFVIENDQALQVSSSYLPSSHNFVTMFLGKQVGDEIPGREDIHWQIVEIKHKYLHLFHTLHEEYDKLIGTNPTIQRMHIDKDNPDFDIIFEQARQQHEHATAILDQYAKKKIPARLIADWLKVTPMDFYDEIPGLSTDLASNDGNYDKMMAAVQLAVDAQDKGCVIDLLTLHILYKLDLLDEVRSYVGEIRVPQSHIDAHLQRCDEIQINVGRDGGSLAPVGDKFTLIETPASVRQMRLDAAHQELAALRQTVTTCPVIAASPETLDREGDPLFPDDFWDDVLVAQDEGLLLISDDYVFRQLASHSFDIKLTGLQALLAAMAEKGALSFEDYATAVAQMARNKHLILTVSAPVLHSVWQTDPDLFESLLSQLCYPSADPYSHLVVATGLLIELWVDLPASLWTQKATSLIIERIVYSGLYETGWFLSFMLSRQYVPFDLKAYMRCWAQGHFISLK